MDKQNTVVEKNNDIHFFTLRWTGP